MEVRQLRDGEKPRKQRGKKEQRGQYFGVFFSFIAIETILYLIFLGMDFGDFDRDLSANFKFLSIVLCFCMATYTATFAYKLKENQLLMLALLFTLVADVFLLFTNRYLWGLLSFIIVQLLYSVRIARMEERIHTIKNRLLARVSISGAIPLVVYLVLGASIEVMLSVVYFTNFISNMLELIFIIIRKKAICKKQEFLFFFIGMLLFFVCDIFVGLYNLSDYVMLSRGTALALDTIAQNMMWLFYLPGQVFIVTSAKKINDFPKIY